MKTFRNILFWAHLISGVTAGIFIFIMCVTGAFLAFEPNIKALAESSQRYVHPPADNAQRLPIKEIIAKVQAAKPDLKPTGVTVQNDKTAAVTVALGREDTIFVNPYTGEITGEGAEEVHEFFEINEGLHRWLMMSGSGRPIGKGLNDAGNLLFLFLAISGVYIWFPRRLSWKHFRAAMALRWKVTGRARDFNWHSVIGFWSSLVLIILTATAVVMSYQWANSLAYRITGNEPPQQQQGPPGGGGGNAQQGEQSNALPENINDLWGKAEKQSTWKTISLRLPVVKDSAVFTIDEGIYWNRFGRSTLTVDAKSGEVAKWEPYGEQNGGRQFRSWIRFSHTGESFGFIGQLIACLACIGGAILVYTGLSLSWRRFKGWRAKPEKVA